MKSRDLDHSGFLKILGVILFRILKNKLNSPDIFIISGKDFLCVKGELMSLNKELWQQALRHYNEWNESKLVHSISSV
jgi:hypothetical protein